MKRIQEIYSSVSFTRSCSDGEFIVCGIKRAGGENWVFSSERGASRFLKQLKEHLGISPELWEELVDQAEANVYNYLWIAKGYSPEPFPSWDTNPVVVHPLMSRASPPEGFMELDDTEDDSLLPRTSDATEIKQLRNALFMALKRSAALASKELGDESIYSFGLYTTREYRYVVDYTMTEQALEATSKKYLRKKTYKTEWGSLAVAEQALKWSTPDSPYVARYESHFSKAQSVLDNLWLKWDEEERDYKESIAKVHEAFAWALSKLSREVLPGDSSILLGIMMGDQSDAEKLINLMELNPGASMRRIRRELEVDSDELKQLRQDRLGNH
ncbi:MAG: DUF4303 domain-containing protein [Pirellulaceae bacterium]